MINWTADDISTQAGRTVIVTGANSGLGLETSKALAAAGARVVMAVRDTERGRQAAAEVGSTAEVRELDLSDLASVREFASSWSDPIAILINNAGVMAVPTRELTRDGFELQFATNHLGPFALTNLLLPQITDRVVTVSSGGHRMGGLDLDDLNWERRRYTKWRAYGQTKLANLLFTLELQRRLDSEHSPRRAVAAHPGLAGTNLFRPRFAWMKRVGDVFINAFGQSQAMGALPQLYAATEDIPGASYVGPNGRGEQTGYPVLVGRSPQAGDRELAKALWLASERLTRVSYRSSPQSGPPPTNPPHTNEGPGPS